jgi:hypothetical protein
MQIGDEYPNITLEQYLIAKRKASDPGASKETIEKYNAFSAVLLNNYT